MRERYCRACGGWHALDRPWPHNCLPARTMTRADFPAPFTRADGMDATWNPCDGKHYESRSQYERAVKSAGCEIVGDDAGHWNQQRPEYATEGLKDDLKRSWDQLS